MVAHCFKGLTATLKGLAKHLRFFHLNGVDLRGVVDPRKLTQLLSGIILATLGQVICPLLSGPSTIVVWTTKEEWNGSEAQARGDHRQAA